MRLSSGRWPSAGFVAVCLTYVLVAAFFTWGFSAPALDRFWTLQQMLKIGKERKLSAAERELLEGCLARCPQLAIDMLDGREMGMVSANRDGWMAAPTAVLLRTSGSRAVRQLLLDVQTPNDLIPYHMVILGRGWKKRLQVTGQELLRVELPPPPDEPELIEVRLRGRSFEPDPSQLGVRIGFGP